MTASAPWIQTPLKLTISITEQCNLSCLHCYADCGRSSRTELDQAAWTAFLDQLTADGIMSVFFEGGEPMLRPDFDAILAHASKSMMVTLRTHATLVTMERARACKALGLGRACVDLLGATAATHDGMTRVAGSFERTVDGIRNFVAAGVPTVMLMILNRRNLPEMQAYLDLAAALGVARVGFLRLYPLGRAKRAWSDLAPSLSETMAALAAIDPPPGVTVMQSWHPNDGNCCWQNAAVNAYGDSIGCPYLREYVNYGNIASQAFLDTWNHPLYRRLRAGRTDASCPDCAGSQGSQGGCRSTAYAYHGRWTAPDPFCSTLNQGVDLRVLPDRLLSQDS